MTMLRVSTLSAGAVLLLGALLPAQRLDRAVGIPLTQLAERMAGCSCFIGHDSGISHLAAAVGLPGVVLWGPTMEEVWRPRGEGIQILRHTQGLHGITVDQVWDAVRGVR